MPIYNPPATPTYNDDYPESADGLPRTVASVTQTTRRAADNIKAVKNAADAAAAAVVLETTSRERAAALDFRTLVHAVVVIFRGMYVAAFRAWGFVGSEDFYAETRDPLQYPTVTAVDAGSLWASNSTYDFDVAPDGALMIFTINGDGSTASDKLQTRNAAGTWATTRVLTTQKYPNVRYDVAHAKWVVAFQDSAGHARVAWSTAASLGVAWTVLATGVAGIPDGAVLTLSYHDGVLVIMATKTTNVYFSRSTDGGLTWSAAVVLALGFTAGGIGFGAAIAFQRPVWTGTKWVAMVGKSDFTSTKVYQSSDGAAWTLVATLGHIGVDVIGLGWYEAIAGCVVASMIFGSSAVMIVSSDDGATWKVSDQEFAAASHPPFFLFSGPNANRLIATDGNGYFYPSAPATPPDSPVTA